MPEEPLDISMRLVWKHKRLLVPTFLAVLVVLIAATVIITNLQNITEMRPDGLWTLLVTLLGLLVVLGLMSAWSLVATRNVLSGDPVDLEESFREGAALFPKLLGMRLVISACIFAPLAFLLLMVVETARYLVYPLTVLPVLAAGLLAIGFLFYITIRFLYATPVLVLEHETISSSLRRTLHISGHHFWRSAIIALFLGILAWIAQNISDGSSQALTAILTNPHTAVWLVPIILVLAVAEAFIAAYEHMYLFQAYRRVIE